MKTIIDYILNMIPYMLISLPPYLLIRFIILKNAKKKINYYHETALLIFIIFLVGLLSQTIIPKFEYGINGFHIIKTRIHKTNLLPFTVLFDTYKEVFINHHLNYFLINFLGNIVIFMPLGFLIPLLWKISNKKVILSGFILSLFIEICQLFLARGSDIDDLILNTLGTYLGLLLYRFLTQKYKKIVTKFK